MSSGSNQAALDNPSPQLLALTQNDERFKQILKNGGADAEELLKAIADLNQDSYLAEKKPEQQAVPVAVAETTQMEPASGGFETIPPIHPSIIRFAHLPLPRIPSDLPPLEILQGDVKLFHYMSQRALATASILSQLAHDQATGATIHTFDRDLGIYEKVHQCAQATVHLLEKDKTLRNHSVTLAAKTAAQSLQASLIVSQPALMLLTANDGRGGMMPPAMKTMILPAPGQLDTIQIAAAMSAAASGTADNDNPTK